jgi:hypothetical protein
MTHPNIQHTSRKPNKRQKRGDARDADESFRMTPMPLSKTRVTNRLKQLRTPYVKEVVEYDDGSEMYTYFDEVQITKRNLEGIKVIGKFINAEQWKEKLIVVFEDDFGEILRLELPESPDDHNEAFDALFTAEQNLVVTMTFTSAASEAKKKEEEHRHLILEMNAIEARHSMCDTLFTQYIAKRSLSDLFTLRSLERGKTGRGKEIVRKEITLQDAKERINHELERCGYKVDRIELCRRLLQRCQIKGKPKYTAAKLNNLVAQDISKQRIMKQVNSR